jgi:hypothetical protein
MRATDLAW